MLGLLLLAILPTLPTNGIIPKGPLTPPSLAEIVPSVPSAERARGAQVADRNGAPLGVIDRSDNALVTVMVGAHKVQLPANALHKVAGKLVVPLMAQQIEQTLAGAAAYQEKTYPSPSPILPPRGFEPLAGVAQDTSQR